MTQSRIRRILDLSGYDIQLGKPGPDDLIGVWGQSPTAPRGQAVSDWTGAGIVRVEDSFLRSVHPGRDGEPPMGLTIDHSGLHFDPAQPSDLETLLATDPLDDTDLMNRAKDAIGHMKEAHLSKYSAFDPDLPPPDPGYVLVIDQTEGDASVTCSGADKAMFQEMLVIAQEENPGCPVLIKTHPETTAGHRSGYLSTQTETDRIKICDQPHSPWVLFEGAVGVYTVSSQLGFEAIYGGHKPKVFGQPFYAGWGLTDDRNPVARRERKLTHAQLFAGAMILYPKWYDPYRDRLCSLEEAINTLQAQSRAWREDRFGWVGHDMRLWKRPHLQRFFGQTRRMIFDKPNKQDRREMVWANKWQADRPQATRLEDGFLRSRGLGAELTPPLSLICDQRGIYYDPTQESDLELLVAWREDLPSWARYRAEAVIASITQLQLSKYNQGGDLPELPTGRRILVPGQVEDDASILTGAGEVKTNLQLLQKTRELNPDAAILYKPHPDVLAGLRDGGVDASAAQEYADIILENINPIKAIKAADEVWTMTSLMGFEALLHRVPVTCLGVPFYAGWGLTTDLAPTPPRRRARPDLTAFVHAALIDYPRYHDPVTNQPCPIEVIIERLADNTVPLPGPANRILSKLQGIFASQARLWR
nr:capsular polysaccharide biosynthesis protein [Pseudaestuariivita rosea]